MHLPRRRRSSLAAAAATVASLAAACGGGLLLLGGWPVAAAPAVAELPSDTEFDVTPFETTVLSRWVAQYQLEGVGNFSFQPGGNDPHPYATSDVAHVLCFTGRLGELSDADRDAYAARINQWQRADGFYDPGTPAGGSLWHAAGYVPAGLSLLGRLPARANALFDRVAATPALWEPTVRALLNADAQPPPFNISSGCTTGYDCAQNIASLLAWQILVNGSATLGGGLRRYSPFADWYLAFLKAQADPTTGLWCTAAQRQKHGTINCIGGSFHVDFVFQFLALHPEYNCSGTASAFPFATQQLNQSLALQQPSGGWTSDGMAYLNVDGLYEVTRPSVQLGRARWDEVEESCRKLMGLIVPVLNNASKLLDIHGVSANSHGLPALVAAVAECQKQFPAMVRSERPWPMCLDSTPYI